MHVVKGWGTERIHRAEETAVALEQGRAERRQSGAQPAGPEMPPSQASFLAAIARGDERSLRLLYVGFAPLLREQAQVLEVRDEDLEPLVCTVLANFALHLVEARHAPREVARYLVGALRNEARKLHRDERRRQGWYDRAGGHHARTGERIVAECHSEYGVRTSLGVDDPADGDADGLDRAVAATPVERLGASAALAFSPEERTLLVGVSRGVPIRVMAEQLGIEYGTARVRVHRTRERLRKLAAGYVATLEGEERREVERFFRRAGVNLAPTRAAKEDP